MFTPTTNLRLLSTPLESDYRNTLWFPNVAAQTAYFTSKTVKTYSAFNYIKKDNTIVVADEVDNLYNCNYIMYQNANFGQRWFYAFINRMEWASNGSTRLYVSTDVIQTWFFDITYYQSYVDRCHSDTDIVGDNIVPEDFTTGNNGGYQVVGSQDMRPNNAAVFATTNAGGLSYDGGTHSGIYSGAGLIGDFDVGIPSTLNTTLQAYVNQGTATAVVKIQQYPAALQSAGAIYPFSKTPTNISGYTPVNKKLLSAAFITCFVSMYGQELNFSPAFITGAIVNVKVSADKTSGAISAFVDNYSNENISTMNLTAVIPESSWSYNQYKNNYNLHSGSNAIYISRNKMNRRLGAYTESINTMTSALNAVSSASSASNIIGLATNPIGALSSSIAGTQSAIADAVNSGAKAYQYATGIDAITEDLTAINESYNAPATGNLSASNGYITTNKTALTYGYKVPPLDLVKRCDKYLSVYGYKQSEYRSINLHARLNWTFIKTIGLNASGNFPDDDMNTIKSAFNNGIFFWNYTSTFGNFDQLNPIV